ncbi:hypothetical protein CDAR_454641 [Caerostris darwini]|uniref:Uncharacterized protein n=1 Tax=Caerostris darwini TaxID=1538125 RepID=A0AAV4TZ64_9ARAC|nr:hypothetical protein CDAR_454641 [Caerostris darwini]
MYHRTIDYMDLPPAQRHWTRQFGISQLQEEWKIDLSWEFLMADPLSGGGGVCDSDVKTNRYRAYTSEDNEYPSVVVRVSEGQRQLA